VARPTTDRAGAPVVTRLAPTECLALLERARVGRVALTIDAMPNVRSVVFALVDRSIVLRVAPGSRLHRAATGAVVAFQADHYDDAAREGWSVVAQGMGHEVADPATLRVCHQLPLDAWSEPPLEDRFLQIPIVVLSGEHVLWPHAGPTGGAGPAGVTATTSPLPPPSRPQR